jgi:hypothetical protein
MKKIIIMLLVIATTNSLKAQTSGVPDTLAYLQSIVANKAQFVGQPFSTLMDSLQIQIKFYFPFASLPYDKAKETSTSFAFYFPPTAEEVYLTYPHLEIYWQLPPDAEQSRTLRSQYRSIGWNLQIANHYSSKIIADIKVRE